MEDYKLLIQEGKYEEALKLLLSREGHYLEKTQCLYEMGKYEENILFFEGIVDLIEEDYNEIFGYYILSLKEVHAYDKALDAINEELSMPYIQEPYYSTLNMLYESILQEKKAYLIENNLSTISLNNEQVKEVLTSDSDFELAFQVIQQLDSMNIRSIINEIEVFLQNKNVSNILKSFVLEMLISQQISESVILVKNDLEYEFTPIANEMVLQNHAYLVTSELLNDHLAKQPSFLEMASEVLDTIAYIIYPETIEEGEEKMYAAAIEYYVYTLNYEDLADDFETYYDCDVASIEKFESYISQLLTSEKELSDVTH